MTKVRKNGRPTTYLEWVEVPPRTAREVELFEEAEPEDQPAADAAEVLAWLREKRD